MLGVSDGLPLTGSSSFVVRVVLLVLGVLLLGFVASGWNGFGCRVRLMLGCVKRLACASIGGATRLLFSDYWVGYRGLCWVRWWGPLWLSNSLIQLLLGGWFGDDMSGTVLFRLVRQCVLRAFAGLGGLLLLGRDLLEPLESVHWD